MEQRIRFCRSGDGVRIAVAEHGAGPVLVKAANWLTHVELDWGGPVWRHWLAELGRGFRVVRYDGRGCGLSDRDPRDVSFEALVGDLEAVADAAGGERFVLLGLSQGAAVAVAYAARHPERVSRLVICGGYARGRLMREPSPGEREEARLLQDVVRVGWGRPDPVFRRVFTTMLVPGGSPEQLEWFDRLQRASATPAMAARLRATWNRIDVSGELERVRAPALVAHARGDRVVPFEEGRLLAAGIPGARFLPLESRNHVLLEDEPAWPVFLAELRRVAGGSGTPGAEGLGELTARELEVLEQVAAGLANEEIARRLGLSTRTVERHLSNIYAKLRLSGKAARAGAAARFSGRAR